ncbi:MAG: glycosyltransferase family 2 protein [Phycisphaerales bacterium]|nr:glycosyltransferase family 2 protein [Phycisphaerae bacterium]NNF42137.1 glycosyltransferase family 2 protein [Phycisphaerales bacterium]NNM25874.1 glycosyltransferase family 2 protein [Phycisphaerales bacterium]
MTDRLPVSVCMIVRNEADRLPRTLAALQDGGPVFEEIVVLDTGSTDETMAICRDAGCRVESAAWEGFAVMRKRSFALARCPWILWLDADEVMTDDLRREIRSQFADGEPSCAGFLINRMVQLEGRWVRHGDWFPDWNLRLFRSGDWSMDDRLVHESIRVTGEVRRLGGLLEHHSFRNWADLRERSDRYARLWAEQERGRGRRAWPGVPVARAAHRFVRGYLLRRGFLDGVTGLRVAWQIAREVRLKHTLLGEKRREGARPSDR